MNILLDCDGVLLDWEHSFKTYASQRLGRPITGEPQQFELSHWLGTTPDEAMDLIHEFNQSEHFGKLNAIPGTKGVLDGWFNSGHDLSVITSCSSDHLITLSRWENLRIHFGEIFFKLVCLDLGQSKSQALSEFDPNYSIWIEDNYKNALCGHRLGIPSFCLRRSHNKAMQRTFEGGVIWADSLVQIAESLFNGKEE